MSLSLPRRCGSPRRSSTSLASPTWPPSVTTQSRSQYVHHFCDGVTTLINHISITAMFTLMKVGAIERAAQRCFKAPRLVRVVSGERVKSSVPVCACAPLTRYRPPTRTPRDALSGARALSTPQRLSTHAIRPPGQTSGGDPGPPAPAALAPRSAARRRVAPPAAPRGAAGTRTGVAGKIRGKGRKVEVTTRTTRTVKGRARRARRRGRKA